MVKLCASKLAITNLTRSASPLFQRELFPVVHSARLFS